ncbi:hypothetical protein M407DRAFT_23208 [Tulasnella calospora MUT 4182]|uniref:Uncharacterized protein n=1 Tax=Tulasnella calospora MUT 4182 TaxID=1051891 RepID=A0A0C3QLK0_9AGAM|nr:hypothetical protein M407DRAFT_23208 [Tulasnella calospora MUT 4182]
MTDTLFTIQSVEEALSITDGFPPEQVADALPSLNLAPDIQAGLIRSWDRPFAEKVLLKWAPTSATWISFLSTSKDDIASLSLMLTVLAMEQARSIISIVGASQPGPRLAQLMMALRAAQLPKVTLHPAANAHQEATLQPNIQITETKKPIQRSVSPLLPHSSTPPSVQSIRPSTPNVLPTPKAEGTSNCDRGFPTKPSVAAPLSADKAACDVSRSPPTRSPHRRRPRVSSSSGPTTTLEKGSPTSSPKEPSQKFVRQATPGLGSDIEEPMLTEAGRQQSSPRRHAKAFPLEDSNSNDSREDVHQEAYDDPGLGDQEGGSENDEDQRSLEDIPIGEEPDNLDPPMPSDEGKPNTLEDEVHEAAPDGYVDPSLSPWTWTQEANDERVEQWDLEGMIEDDRTSTAAARTKWMYETRLGKMTEEEYEQRREAEFSSFMEIPVACRNAVGLVFYKDSKFDWEIRVFLSPHIYKYVILKIDEEEAAKEGDNAKAKNLKDERTELLDKTMKKLLERFPDCHPDHSLCQIKKNLGAKAETKFLASFRNKFTSDAGCMKTCYLKSAGAVGGVGARTSTSTLLEILGRKRAHIAFHLWGGSEAGGKKVCNERIEKEMEEWKKSNPLAKPVVVSRHRITVVHTVRYILFKDQLDDVRELWSRRAKALHIPKTPEEEQCLVDAALPYLLELLALLAERADMHFLLFAAGRGSCNIPVVMEEFARKRPESNTFITTFDGLGTRLKPQYIEYISKTLRADVSEAAVEVFGVDFNVDMEEGQTEDGVVDKVLAKGPGIKQTKPGGRPQTYIPAFRPDLTTIKKVTQMEKAISEWILSAIATIHGARPTWNKLTKYPHHYIDVNCMPMDPDHPSQRLPLQRPSTMSDLRTKALFTFLVNSYNGTLGENERFKFKHESRHLDLPSPGTPDDPSVHYAAAVAAKTKVPDRKRSAGSSKEAKGRRAKAVVEPPQEDDGYGDLPGLMVEDAAATLDQALKNSSAPKKSRKRSALRIESPPPDAGERSDSKASAVRSWPKPGTILEPDTDELSHPQFVLGKVSDAGLWAKTKERLAEFGSKIQFLDSKSRTLPFLGLLVTRPDLQLPTGLSAVLSVLQMWDAYQAPSDPEPVPKISIKPMLGLESLHSSHYVSVTIRTISDSTRSLPTAKHIYDQILFSEESAGALFLHLESVVSHFIDRIVDSEETILSANLDLLESFRLTLFVRASGFIRDIGKTQSNTIRTSSLTDRFISVVAAIGFARYMKVVLSRVAQLYCEESQDESLKSMWEEVSKVWEVGCSSLARALVRGRSDIFSLEHLTPVLPENFSALIEYAFTDRPWWSPGSAGAPGPVKIVNKQSVATDGLFRLLKSVTWSQLSFIERGQVMLLVFLAAIQIQKGRVAASAPSLVLLQLTESLKELGSLIEESDEVGPILDPFSVPTDAVACWIEVWAKESQQGTNIVKESADAEVDGDPIAMRTSIEGACTTVPQDHCEGVDPVIATTGEPLQDPPELSSVTVSSVLPYEDEDPTFSLTLSASANTPLDDANLTNEDPPAATPAIRKLEDINLENEGPPDAIPAIRKLDEGPMPSPKKRRLREVSPVRDLAVNSAGRALRSAAKVTAQASNPPPVQAGVKTRGRVGQATTGSTAKGNGKTTAQGAGEASGGSTRSAPATRNAASKATPRRTSAKAKGKAKAT